jgi:multidrug efflux pump subunit AcrB
VKTAVKEAVARRIRPILLTAATTVAGLLPLAFSESTLWPPLASAMISGLIASTLLTLAVLPAAYRLVFVRKRRRIRTAKVKRPSGSVLMDLN